MRSTVDLHHVIESRIKQWLDTTAPTDVHRRAVEKLNVLPLTSDAGGFYAMTIAATVVEVHWDDVLAHEVTDARALNVALFQGAKRYPELASLLPNRPPNAVPCISCGGTGEPTDIPPHLQNAVVCYCGGAGWLPSGVPQLGSAESAQTKVFSSAKLLSGPIVLSTLAILLLLAGGYVSVAAIAGASLGCVRCDCRYSILAADPSCRWPAIWTYASYACFVSFALVLVLAWREYRRRLTSR